MLPMLLLGKATANYHSIGFSGQLGLVVLVVSDCGELDTLPVTDLYSIGVAVSGGGAYMRYAYSSPDSVRAKRIEIAYNVSTMLFTT